MRHKKYQVNELKKALENVWVQIDEYLERPHGFRSSLRTWLAECTDAPHEVCETILAHKSGTDVQMSYRRTDFKDRTERLGTARPSHQAEGLRVIACLESVKMGSAAGT